MVDDKLVDGWGRPLTSGTRVYMASERISDEQRPLIKRYITAGYPRGESCVVGVLIEENDELLLVRMFGAQCLHDGYVLRRDEVLRVDDHELKGTPTSNWG
jgi:hypothetical protein